MTTQVKPQRIKSTNSPALGQVPAFSSADEFVRVDPATGGLPAVSHDATLAGDGTVGDPLSVVGGGSGGSITRDIKTSGVIYQAGSGGGFITINFGYDWIIYSDATPTPTTVIGHWNHPNYGYGSMTVAIKPNEYYQVTGGVQDYYYSEAGGVGPAGPSGTGGNIVFVSDNYPTCPTTSDVITHNLNVTQADVEAGRYKVIITGSTISYGIVLDNIIYSNGFEGSEWTSADPTNKVSRQANTLKTKIDTGGAVTNVRVIIEDLRLQTGGMGSGAGQTVYISPAQSGTMTGATYTITHNLNITQSDVEAARYKLLFTRQESGLGGDGHSHFQLSDSFYSEQSINYVWSASDPGNSQFFNFQANTLKVTDGGGANAFTNLRVHIIDTWVTNAKAGVNDTAYGASWNGNTTEAPSQNAVYDKIETLGQGTTYLGDATAIKKIAITKKRAGTNINMPTQYLDLGELVADWDRVEFTGGILLRINSGGGMTNFYSMYGGYNYSKAENASHGLEYYSVGGGLQIYFKPAMTNPHIYANTEYGTPWLESRLITNSTNWLIANVGARGNNNYPWEIILTGEITLYKI